MPLNEHDLKMAALEAALAALVPMPGRLNRDALLFRAGQASVRGRPWLWPAATAALGLAAAALGVLVMVRPAPAPVERIVYVAVKEAPPGPAASVPAPPPPALELVVASEPSVGKVPITYLQLEQQVLRWGLDGVPATPEPPPSSAPPMTRESLLRAAPAPPPFPNLFHLGSFFQ